MPCDNVEQKDSYVIATDIYNMDDAILEMKHLDAPNSEYQSFNVKDVQMVGSFDKNTPCGNIYC